MGRTEFPDPQGLRASLWLERQLFLESEMALFFECRLKCAENMLDTADIVREAIFRHLSAKLPKIRIEKEAKIFGWRDYSIVDNGNSFVRQVHALRIHVTLIPERNGCSHAIRLSLNRYLATNRISRFAGSD